MGADNCFEIDFDKSLLRHGKDLTIYQVLTKNERPASGEILELVSLLKSLFYKRKKPLETIPKKVHQIWLGKTLPPKDYIPWMESWKHLPGFTYRLWTDADIAECSIQNRTLFEQAGNLGAKSDILRYEILCRFGGVYVDADTECFHSELLGTLCENLSFFAGIEPLSQALGIWIGNSVIGAAAGSPIMKRLIDKLPAGYPPGDTSPVFVTGPAYFSHQVKKMVVSKEMPQGAVIFPTTFFSPHTKNEALSAARERRTPEVFAETICAHYYGKSWHKTNYEMLKEKPLTPYPSFEKAFQHTKKEREAFKFVSHPLHRDREKYLNLQALYHLQENAGKGGISIPKLIHQIEPAPITTRNLNLLVSWMGIQGFTYHLWSKKELMDTFPEIHQMPNAKKMDFAKFSILTRFGGIYAESNLFCFDEVFFDEIVARVSFFAGLEPIAEVKRLILSTQLMGAAPNLTLFQAALELLKQEGIDGAKALTAAFFSEKEAAYERVVFPPSFFWPFDLADLQQLNKSKKTPEIPPECAALRAYDPVFKKRVLI